MISIQGDGIKVSVIVPVYNTEAYLEETIASIRNQTLIDLEIIIVNDGSTDGSLDICLKSRKIDSRIYVIDQRNSGVSVARNKGLAKARGEYVFFLDADDTIAPDFFELAYRQAELKKSDIVVLGDYYCRRILSGTKVLPVCAQFIRHSFLLEFSDVRFPIGIQPCEDGLFSHQLFALTDKYSFCPEAAYHYRQHSEQNHLTINCQGYRVVEQIPLWFEILESFYLNYDLFDRKSLHLARFLEHEPFEFRYLKMPLDVSTKGILYDMIREFYSKRVKDFLSPTDFRQLTFLFKEFLLSKDVAAFEDILNIYVRRKKKRINLARFIPFRGYRRKIRSRIQSLLDSINR